MSNTAENIATKVEISDEVKELFANSGTPLKETETEEKEDEDLDENHDKPKDEKKEAPKDEKKGDENEDADKSKKEEAKSKEGGKIEIDNDAVVAFLKSQNIDISSIDEIKDKFTKKEDETDPAVVAVKKLKVKEYAITNKIVTPDILDKYEADSKLPATEIAFRLYHEARKNETNETTNEVYTEDELRTEFESEYNLGEDDNNPFKKRSLQNIDLIAQAYMHSNYKELNKLDSLYETAQQEINLQATVTDIKKQIAKDGLHYSIPTDTEGQSIDVTLPISAKDLKEVQLAVTELQGNNNTDDVKSLVIAKLLLKNHPKIVNEVATAYHSELMKQKLAKSKGIEPRKAGEPDEHGVKIPAEVQTLLDNAEKNRKQNN